MNEQIEVLAPQRTGAGHLTIALGGRVNAPAISRNSRHAQFDE